MRPQKKKKTLWILRDADTGAAVVNHLWLPCFIQIWSCCSGCSTSTKTQDLYKCTKTGPNVAPQGKASFRAASFFGVPSGLTFQHQHVLCIYCSSFFSGATSFQHRSYDYIKKTYNFNTSTLLSYHYKQKKNKPKTESLRTALDFIRKGDTKPKWIWSQLSQLHIILEGQSGVFHTQ